MKLLILSSNNGGGHNSVAAAIREYYELQGYEVVVEDCVSFLSERVSDLMSSSHVFIYRHLPVFFEDSYRNGSAKNKLFEEEQPLRQIINLGKYNLGEFIQEEGFHTVICTHVFGGMMLTAAIEQFNLSIRTAIVETDYCNTPGSINNDLDYHFIPYATLAHELVHYGIDEKRIVVSGIPVRSEAVSTKNKAESKAKLGIPENRAHVLVMGGSMGGGLIPSLAEQLYEAVREIADVSIICGTNEKLKKAIRAKHKGQKDIHVYGFVKDMSELYSSADVFVTKPGGISTTEAAVNGLPMVLLNGAAACEELNLNFFVDHGAAISGKTEAELAKACRTLLEDEGKRSTMSEILRRIGNRDAAKIIYETLEKPKK